jgi:hypothetical protein
VITKKSKKIVYYSDDYNVEMRHKITGKKIPEHRWYWSQTKIDKIEKDYKLVVVSGYAIEFDSKKNKTYKRLIREQIKRKIYSSSYMLRLSPCA